MLRSNAEVQLQRIQIRVWREAPNNSIAILCQLQRSLGGAPRGDCASPGYVSRSL